MEAASVTGSELYANFDCFCKRLQVSLRHVGVIVLQLIERRLFTEEESEHWMRWLPVNVSVRENIEGVFSKQHLTAVGTQLVSICPLLLQSPPPVAELLALCFIGKLSPKVDSQQSRKGMNSISISFPAWKTLAAIVSKLEDLTIEQNLASKFVKEIEW
jgi:hypothetical protein